MQYEQVWNAVDKLASSQGLSPSGLAKKPDLMRRRLTKANVSGRTEKNAGLRLTALTKFWKSAGLRLNSFIIWPRENPPSNLRPLSRLSNLRN